MKNLSEVLEDFPAAQLQQPGALTEEAVEQLLASLSNQATARRQIREPLDPNLLFKFGCLGLGAVFAVVVGLVAYWNRPVQALAQAQMMQDMGLALVESQQQVKEAIATANPPQFKCGARLFGDCNFPDQAPPPSSAQTAGMPARSAHYPQAIQTLEVSTPGGLGAPAMAAEPPEDAALSWAKQQLLAWESVGYAPAQTKDFIHRLRQQPDPQFPAAEHLSIAHVRRYGASF